MVGQRELVQVEAADIGPPPFFLLRGLRGGWSCGQGSSWNAFQAVRLRSVSQRGSSREARNVSKASWPSPAAIVSVMLCEGHEM